MTLTKLGLFLPVLDIFCGTAVSSDLPTVRWAYRF